jgi:hypothetical protein
MKTTQALVKQAIAKKEQKKIIAPISETKKVELEKVPESELKRPKVTGWVKEKGMKSIQELEDEKRQAFQERMKIIKEEKRAEASGTAPSMLRTTRELPAIPKGEEVSMSVFCPSCGKDLKWSYCPYCGKPLPH